MTALVAAFLFGTEPVVSVAVLVPNRIEQGEALPYVVVLEPKEGWHLYWLNPGDSGLPPTVKWDLPEGWRTTDLQFPAPSRIVSGDSVSYGYEKRFGLVGSFTVPTNFAPGEYEVKGKVSWMACRESCVMGATDIVAKFRVGIPTVGARVTDDVQYRKDVQMPKLEVNATYRDGAYTLSLPDTIDGQPYFYCQEEGVLANAKEQKWANGRLTLPKSEFANGTAKKLRGILQVQKSKEFINYRIDTAID